MNKKIGNEELEKILDRIHEWIRGADQKISVFLAFEGIIITLLALPVFSWIKSRYLSFDLIVMIMLYFSFSFLLYGFLKTLYALSPSLSQRQGHSFTFFGDIAKTKFETFKNHIKKTSQQDYRNELINQIHVVSKIANRKHSNFRDSMLLFCMGILLTLSAFFYFSYHYGF